jgi:hypothetical protein
MSRYARKRDETHAPIRDGLRERGYWVADTADCPGFIDLVVCARLLGSWRFLLLEVKREKGPRGGGGGRITEAQKTLMDSCPGEIHVVRTLEEALDAVHGKRIEKREP